MPNHSKIKLCKHWVFIIKELKLIEVKKCKAASKNMEETIEDKFVLQKIVEISACY